MRLLLNEKKRSAHQHACFFFVEVSENCRTGHGEEQRGFVTICIKPFDHRAHDAKNSHVIRHRDDKSLRRF